MKLLPISRFTVSGESMSKTLLPGQSVITLNWFLNLKVGDIVVAIWRQKLIIKRIFKIKSNSIYLKGDNIKKSTTPKNLGVFSKKDILGKVILIL